MSEEVEIPEDQLPGALHLKAGKVIQTFMVIYGGFLLLVLSVWAYLSFTGAS